VVVDLNHYQISELLHQKEQKEAHQQKQKAVKRVQLLHQQHKNISKFI
jgi:hypothetical protein